jgi:hypothetical protein
MALCIFAVPQFQSHVYDGNSSEVPCHSPIFPNEAEIGSVAAAPEEDLSVETVEELSR